MMLKKLSSLLCVLLIAASLAVTCFAQPAAESGTNNGVGTSQNATTDKKVYTLEVAGNENITEKEQTYMTFVVTDLEGKDFEIYLRIKKDTSGKCRIRVTNKAGNSLQNKGTNSPYIQQNNFTSSNSFEITVTSDSLIINGTACIKDVTSISDVKVVFGNDSKPENTTAATTPSPSSSVPTDSNQDANEQVDNKDNEDSEKSLSKIAKIICIVIAVLVVAVSGVVGFIVAKKHKIDSKSRFKSEPKIESKPKKKTKTEKKASEKDVVNINNAEAPVQEADALSKIPVCYAEPIIHTVNYTYDKTSVSTQNATANETVNNPSTIIHQSVVGVLLGNTDSSSLPETCLPLLLMNSYDLSISDLMEPYFRLSSDKENAQYVVVDEEKLYINPIKYNGDNFKAYSGLTCLDKCFTIMCDYNEVKPQGQRIINIEPAILQRTGSDYILVKKGLLNVE